MTFASGLLSPSFFYGSTQGSCTANIYVLLMNGGVCCFRGTWRRPWETSRWRAWTGTEPLLEHTYLPAQHVPDTLYLGVNKANAVFLLFKFKINSTLLSFSVMLRQKVESSGSVKFS